jgi:membrane protein DedA with SNARE-associated domain
MIPEGSAGVSVAEEGRGTGETVSAGPALPWRGRPERADLIIWFGIMLSGLYYLALIPVKPLLIGRNPLMLEYIDGSMTSVITAGAFARVGRVPLVLAVLGPVPVTMMFDPLFWWAGRRWGRSVIELLAGRGRRSRRMLVRGQRLFRRFGGLAVVLAYMLPIPSSVTYAFAGWSGMRLRIFLVLDLAGTLLWSGLLVWLGYGLGSGAVHAAETISDYGIYLSIALLGAIVLAQVWRVRRGRVPVAADEAAAAFEESAGLGYRVRGE